MKKLTNKTIWVTGASSGIGEALAKRFASLGATLVLSGRKVEKLSEVRQACSNSDKHIVVPFDITDAKATEAAYAIVKANVKQVDWLINNAGLSQRALILETTEEVERKLMEVDYFAQTRLTRHVLPDMLAKGSGKVVMVSSVAGLLGTQYRGAYSAAKAAIHMWANSLRAELHDKGIQVATVFPGFVQTNISINALTGDGTEQGTMDEKTSAGLTAEEYASRVVSALVKNKEYVVVGGKKEILGTLVNRLSPPQLYKVIRKNAVK